VRSSRLALVLLTTLALLLAASSAAASESAEREALEIARLLKCPVCQNLAVADSGSELAGQMREIIRRKVEAGESRDAILAYFVSAYGEEVLATPQTGGFTGLVWLGAAAIPLAGLAVTALYLRRRLTPSPTADSAADDAEEATAW
jgi:cytochrome c-type biogenesis protein CcmH